MTIATKYVRFQTETRRHLWKDQIIFYRHFRILEINSLREFEILNFGIVIFSFRIAMASEYHGAPTSI